MEYKQITDVKKPVSRIVFGTAIPSMIRGENAGKLLDEVFSTGINTFDLARCYGMAEKAFGDWMTAKKNRDAVVILTKGAHMLENTGRARLTPEAIREDVEMSLQMLQTDFIDIYMLHQDDPKAPVGPLVETLNELREEGKIGIFGGFNWRYDRIDKANEYAYSHDLFGFTVSSLSCSLAEQISDPWGGGCVDISGKKSERERKWYQEEGIEVFAYASLAHGFLSGKFRSNEEKRAKKALDQFAVNAYFGPDNFERLKRAEVLARRKKVTVPQIALAWVLCQPLSPFAICSASSGKRMLSDTKALEIKLTEEEMRWLRDGER